MIWRHAEDAGITIDDIAEHAAVPADVNELDVKVAGNGQIELIGLAGATPAVVAVAT